MPDDFSEPHDPASPFAAFGNRPRDSSQRPLRARGPVDPRAARFPPRFPNRNRGGATDVDGADVYDPELMGVYQPDAPDAPSATDPADIDVIDVEAVEIDTVEVDTVEVDAVEVKAVKVETVNVQPVHTTTGDKGSAGGTVGTGTGTGAGVGEPPARPEAQTGPVGPMGPVDPLEALARWAEPRAGGLWPMANRIELVSTSTGGWRLTVPLAGTPLAERHCKGGLVQRSATDHLRYGVHQGQFVGLAGPLNLAELVRAFTDFAG